jgi:hypothetical protein
VEPRPVPGSGRRIAASYAILCALALAPILAFDYPGIVDHPNHLARLYVLSSSPDSTLHQVYQPAWAIIPNVALDSLGVVLHPWLSPVAVLKLATLLGLGGVLLGVALLQRRVLGELNPLVWLASVPIFNIATSMGYVNYILGLAVVLHATWLWLVLGERPLWVRALVFNLLGAVLFFCHISALGLFGLIALSWDLGRLRREGGLGVAGLLRLAGSLGALFALPLLLVLLAERPEQIARFHYYGKARILMAATYVPNRPAFLLVSVASGLLVYDLLRKRLLLVAPAMRPTLWLLALMTVLLPSNVSSAIDVDTRVLVCMVFLCIASTRIVNPRRRRVVALGLILLSVVSARSILLSVQWRARSQEIEAFRADIAQIEPGAAVLAAGWPPGGARCAEALPEPVQLFWHLPSFAVVDRGAFVPLVFTGRGMQPIRATQRYRPLDAGSGIPVPPELLDMAAQPEPSDRLRQLLDEKQIPGYFVDWPHRFDYLVFLHQGCRSPIEPGHLLELSDGSFYTLYRVLPGSGRLLAGGPS